MTMKFPWPAPKHPIDHRQNLRAPAVFFMLPLLLLLLLLLYRVSLKRYPVLRSDYGTQKGGWTEDKLFFLLFNMQKPTPFPFPLGGFMRLANQLI